MIPRKRLLGAGLAVLGTAAAGTATAAALARRRRVRGLRDAAEEHGEDFGGLRGEPVQVVADDGVALHAEVDGLDPDAGPGPERATVVFVHGYALNLDCFHFQRAHFRGRRRLVLYDQRSHGRSARSTAENATIDQLGHDLRTVLDTLVPEGPVVLVGHSMGGMTVMALADDHPEIFGDRVTGVALIATTAGGLRTHHTISRLLPDRLMGQVTPRVLAALSRVPHLVENARRAGSDLGFLATGRFAFGGEVPPSYVAFVDRMLSQTPFEVLAEFFPNFDTLDKFHVLHAFHQIPTLIVAGTEDVLTSVDHSRKMAKRIPEAQLVEAVGAGHLVILEQAGLVNSALERLVADSESRHAARTS